MAVTKAFLALFGFLMMTIFLDYLLERREKKQKKRGKKR